MKLAFYLGQFGTDLDRRIAAHDHPNRYSHVELWFDNVEGQPCFSSSNRDGGVRFKSIDLTSGKWELVDVPCRHFEELDVHRWCGTKVGGRYDWPGVLGFVIPFLRHKRNRWFCSEICTAALQRVGRLAGVVPHRTTPNKLHWLVVGGAL
jgi:hypothetical protein